MCSGKRGEMNDELLTEEQRKAFINLIEELIVLNDERVNKILNKYFH